MSGALDKVTEVVGGAAGEVMSMFGVGPSSSGTKHKTTLLGLPPSLSAPTTDDAKRRVSQERRTLSRRGGGRVSTMLTDNENNLG